MCYLQLTQTPQIIIQFRLANGKGLAFEANISGSTTTVEGANTLIESQQFAKRRFAHVAVTRDLTEEKCIYTIMVIQ